MMQWKRVLKKSLLGATTFLTAYFFIRPHQIATLSFHEWVSIVSSCLFAGVIVGLRNFLKHRKDK